MPRSDPVGMDPHTDRRLIKNRISLNNRQTSLLSVDGWDPAPACGLAHMIHRISYISGGAGLLPSTVSPVFIRLYSEWFTSSRISLPLHPMIQIHSQKKLTKSLWKDSKTKNTQAVFFISSCSSNFNQIKNKKTYVFPTSNWSHHFSVLATSTKQNWHPIRPPLRSDSQTCTWEVFVSLYEWLQIGNPQLAKIHKYRCHQYIYKLYLQYQVKNMFFFDFKRCSLYNTEWNRCWENFTFFHCVLFCFPCPHGPICPIFKKTSTMHSNWDLDEDVP